MAASKEVTMDGSGKGASCQSKCKDADSLYDSDDDEDEELDPRVKLELEKLNAATDGINHLETEYGEAQALFRQMLSEATAQLKGCAQKLGKSIEKARPYYEALKKAKQAQHTLHEAALQFESAQSRHHTAKIRVADAERRAFSDASRRLDPALQEMLNQATIEVMEASSVRNESWKNHQEAAAVFEEAQKNVQQLYKGLFKNITKSRPYFELKMALNKALEQQKQRLEKIQDGIQFAKQQYAETLKNLEHISDDIHRMRKLRDQKFSALQPREEGVGAESTSEEETSDSNKLITADDLDSMSSLNAEGILIERSYSESSISSDRSSRLNGQSDSKASENDADNLKILEKKGDEYGYEVIHSRDIPPIPTVPEILPDVVDGGTLRRKLSNLRRWKSTTVLEDSRHSMNEASDTLGPRTKSVCFMENQRPGGKRSKSFIGQLFFPDSQDDPKPQDENVVSSKESDNKNDPSVSFSVAIDDDDSIGYRTVYRTKSGGAADFHRKRLSSAGLEGRRHSADDCLRVVKPSLLEGLFKFASFNHLQMTRSDEQCPGENQKETVKDDEEIYEIIVEDLPKKTVKKSGSDTEETSVTTDSIKNEPCQDEIEGQEDQKNKSNSSSKDQTPVSVTTEENNNVNEKDRKVES